MDGNSGPLPPNQLTVPAEHRLGRHEEGAPSLPRQVAAGRGEEGAVAPAEPRPADLPPEYSQLVAQNHDLQDLWRPRSGTGAERAVAAGPGCHKRPHHWRFSRS